MMEDDTFFTHFIVGALLILAACVAALVGFLLWALWSAGFGVFVLIMSILFGFSWTVHRLASSETVKKWLDLL